jgi:Suppressor of fused protein (SUFU)
MYLQPFQVWALNLLKVLAEYPAQQGAAFARYHTVPIGYRLTDASEISAFLLAPPDMEELSRLAFDGYDGPVDYLLIVPITMTEHAYAREVGSEDLYQRLKQADLLVHRDAHRLSAIEYEPLESE